MIIDFRNYHTVPTSLSRPCKLLDADGVEYKGRVYRINLTTGECEEYVKSDNGIPEKDGDDLKRRVFTLKAPLTLMDANGNQWKG